jgi:hypothetical protein
MDDDQVVAAFDLLIDAIGDAISALNERGALAFQSGKYPLAKALTGRGTRIEAFRAKVLKLKREWLRITTDRKTKRRSAPSARESEKGPSTSRDTFFLPILESLAELGGRASHTEVLARVEEKMQDRLKAHDPMPLPSGGEIRWQNNARWARHKMVKEGLMSADSPRGVWEITERGRRYLEEAASSNGQ